MRVSGFPGVEVPPAVATGQGKNLLALTGAKDYY
jgi:hypothetical protein